MTPANYGSVFSCCLRLRRRLPSSPPQTLLHAGGTSPVEKYRVVLHDKTRGGNFFLPEGTIRQLKRTIAGTTVKVVVMRLPRALVQSP